MSYPTATISHPRSLSAAAGESGSDAAVAGFEVTTRALMWRYTICQALDGQQRRLLLRRENQGLETKKSWRPGGDAGSAGHYLRGRLAPREPDAILVGGWTIFTARSAARNAARCASSSRARGCSSATSASRCATTSSRRKRRL